MTDSTLASPLRRLHEALVRALRERDPAGLKRPFTVAEIYQDLVPYRTYRDVLGVEMNGDYEHLVLRLLSGEGGFVAMESEHARKEIADELGRKNPNTGLFREYAAVDVHLVVQHIPEEGADDEAVILPAPATSSPDRDDEEATAASVDDFAPADEDEADFPADDEADFPADDEADFPVDDDGETPSPTEPSMQESGALPGDEGACFWCRGTLPVRENLNFCPFCGTDIAVVPCTACGEAVEPGWRFCIQCGASSGEG